MNQAESARLLSVAIVLTLISTLGAESLGQNNRSAKGPATERIGPSAMWLPGTDFLKSAHAACDVNPSTTIAGCLIGEMAKAGAPGRSGPV